MLRRALLFINEHSRSGAEVKDEVIAKLHQLGIACDLVKCDRSEEISPKILNRSENIDIVIVAGGDGTLRAAADALRKIKKPLGIIPTGTANDLARTLGIPTDFGKAIEVIAQGEIKKIDVGSVNDQLYFNVASLGLSVILASRLTGELKSKFGKLGYAIAALRALAHARPFSASIRFGANIKRSHTMQIAIGNGRFYGGGNVVHENARIDDGKLNFYSLEFVTIWKIALLMPRFRSGKHIENDQVLALVDEEFEIQTRRPRDINADGEIVTRTPAIFKVIPRAVSVIVPRNIIEKTNLAM